MAPLANRWVKQEDQLNHISRFVRNGGLGIAGESLCRSV